MCNKTNLEFDFEKNVKLQRSLRKIVHIFTTYNNIKIISKLATLKGKTFFYYPYCIIYLLDNFANVRTNITNYSDI